MPLSEPMFLNVLTVLRRYIISLKNVNETTKTAASSYERQRKIIKISHMKNMKNIFQVTSKTNMGHCVNTAATTLRVCHKEDDWERPTPGYMCTRQICMWWMHRFMQMMANIWTFVTVFLYISLQTFCMKNRLPTSPHTIIAVKLKKKYSI